MKLKSLFILLGLSLFVLGCSPKYIKIKEEAKAENFTNEQLRNYIKKNPSPVIVVRSTGITGSISSSSGSDRICSVLEMALAKNGFDVRDRSLFESVATSGKTGREISYQDIYKATAVDLLLEVSHYSLSDYYSVDGYYKGNTFHRFAPIRDGSRRYQPHYLFRGMSLTIKVIVLKDNIVGGSYSYSYVPCSEESGGAEIVRLDPLTYRENKGSRDIDAVLDDERNSGLIERQSQKLDRAMEEFLTGTVVPGMMNDIRGISSVMSRKETQSVSSPAASPFKNRYKKDEEVSDVTVDSLMKQYQIEDLLSQYETALSDGRKEDAKAVNKSIIEAKRMVNTDMTIPFNVRTTFFSQVGLRVQKIDKSVKEKALAKAKEEADKNRHKVQEEKEKNRAQTKEAVTAEKTVAEPFDATLTSIVAVNSNGKLSSAVSSLVEQQAINQMNKQKALLKKEKDIDELEASFAAIKTELGKWDYLKVDALSEINRFALTSISPAGVNMPLDPKSIVFFLPMLSSKQEPDSVIYLFLDGACIGVGTQNKGFYVNLDSSTQTATFHQLKIFASNSKMNSKVCIFDSTLQFEIRKSYEFIREDTKGQLKTLKLK